jgi:large subunit ribosomal protein L5
MDVPRLQKITLNMGIGDAKTEAKVLENALDQLTTIAGQRAQVRRARKSIASFKLREGMPVGVRVTLRGARMWEFLDRLISIALPRIRDFRGLSTRSFDGRGNFSLGIREQIIFPEINYDDVDTIRGLDVAITTTAADNEQAEALLRGLGMPFPGMAEPHPKETRSSGQEIPRRQSLAPAEVQGAELHALPPLRPPPRGLSQVRPLPDLPARARARRLDPRHDQEFLVMRSGYRMTICGTEDA